MGNAATDLLEWWADAEDPAVFQLEVLDWLERIGMERPAEALITRVWVERAGEGAVVRVRRFIQPLCEPVETVTDSLLLAARPPERPW